MKALIALLFISFSLSAAAKDPGLADYCGTLNHDLESVTVTLPAPGRTYQVVSSEKMPVELLVFEFPNGGSVCVRGWVDYDDPNRIILYDFFPF